MVDSKTLARSLTTFAGLGEKLKSASALTPKTDQPVNNEKLQLIVGDIGEQKSTFFQVTPTQGNNLLANPLSPLQGDEIFYMGLQPGSRYQSHDGQWWEIEAYDWEGAVEVRNVWYPRIGGTVSIQDVRKSIYAWIEPFQQVVPPIPVGVDYGIVETKPVN